MIKKCLGCGSIIQCDDEKSPGYVDKENYDKSVVCKRCFRITNYGDYSFVEKSEADYKKIFDNIKSKDNLVLFLCDIFTLDETIKYLNDFSAEVILVITKKDLLPKSVKEYKIINYIKTKYNIKSKDIIFVSSNLNYNLDYLFNKIKSSKKNNKVYLVGNTNAGKSTLINALMKSYTDEKSLITTSKLPATTLDLIEVKLTDDITLVDTPGLITKGNFLNYVDIKDIKKISPKVEIKPRTYQMKPNQSLIIGDYARIDYISDTPNSFTLYLSNEIKVDRIKLNTNDKLRNLKSTSFDLKEKKDVVISGLLFCKITKPAKVNIYTIDKALVYERDNLI